MRGDFSWSKIPGLRQGGLGTTVSINRNYGMPGLGCLDLTLPSESFQRLHFAKSFSLAEDFFLARLIEWQRICEIQKLKLLMPIPPVGST